MSLHKKYTRIIRSIGRMSMMGTLSSVNELPSQATTGSLYLMRDTNSVMVYDGSEWEFLSMFGYADVEIPPKHTEEELDYMNNVKPFISFVSGEGTNDRIDLIRGILKAKRRYESSRFVLFDI